MRQLSNRTVAVTGLGVLAPGGIGAIEFWSGLLQPVADEWVRRALGCPRGRWLTHRETRTLDRSDQFAVAVADEACAMPACSRIRPPTLVTSRAESWTGTWTEEDSASSSAPESAA